MHSFYRVMEHVSPVLATGLLGCASNEELVSMCSEFKHHFMAYLRDIFTNENGRYDTIEGLARDLDSLAKGHISELCTKMGIPEIV